MTDLDEITGAIVDAALKIHTELGPGLMETVYEVVLARVLERKGFTVERQKAVRFQYDGVMFEEGFKADLIIEGRVIVELKSIEKLAAVHRLRRAGRRQEREQQPGDAALQAHGVECPYCVPRPAARSWRGARGDQRAGAAGSSSTSGTLAVPFTSVKS